MPYTLTMSLLWLVLAAVAGVVVGYLFRGRTSVVTTGHHPAGREAALAARAVQTASDHEAELDQLRQQVERLDTQLSITVAERDRLRQQLESPDPVTEPVVEPAVGPVVGPVAVDPEESTRDGRAGDRVLE